MAGRRRVDDESHVLARGIGEQIGEGEQREDLVDAGESRIDQSVDVHSVEIRATIDDLGDRLAPTVEEFAAELRGGQLPGVEVWLAGDGGFGPRQRSPDPGGGRRA